MLRQKPHPTPDSNAIGMRQAQLGLGVADWAFRIVSRRGVCQCHEVCRLPRLGAGLAGFAARLSPEHAAQANTRFPTNPELLLLMFLLETDAGDGFSLRCRSAEAACDWARTGSVASAFPFIPRDTPGDMAAAGYPLSLHVLCGSCQTVVGAPLGHPVVRCGNCSSLLRIGGAVRFGSHQQSLSPAIQEYLAQRRAAATRTQQSQPASKAASQSAIDALKRFSATEAWLRDEGNPECVITAEGECAR